MSPIFRHKTSVQQLDEYIREWEGSYGHPPCSVVISRKTYVSLLSELDRGQWIITSMETLDTTYKGVVLDIRSDEELAKLENPT